MRIAYLGPPGTNTEAAARTQTDLANVEFIACASIREVALAVEKLAADAGLIPIENSIEGSVNTTLDLLAFETSLLIRREIVARVDLVLLGRPGAKLGDITQVISHPHANAQCQSSLQQLLPEATLRAANSTAEAARMVSTSHTFEGTAALATRLAGTIYGLDVLADHIVDHPGAETRYVLLGRGVPTRTGADRTSIICFLEKDRPGSLLTILQEFAVRGLNLTKIESRPTKSHLGDYCFFIDIEGHLDDALVIDALKGLRFRLREVKFIGCYPTARSSGSVSEGRAAAAWAEADRWIDCLSAMVNK